MFSVSGDHVKYLFERISSFLNCRKNDVAQYYVSCGKIDKIALDDIYKLSHALAVLECTFHDLEANLTLPWDHFDECSKGYFDFKKSMYPEEYNK